jgi:hypothetical protein
MTDFYKDLRALHETSFPKRCGNCGKVFPSLDQFLSETRAVREASGLTETSLRAQRRLISLFRNCACGSTLMTECRDRRRTDLAGLRQREAFANLLRMMVDRGVRREKARRELLAVMRGAESQLLAGLGVPLKDPDAEPMIPLRDVPDTR